MSDSSKAKQPERRSAPLSAAEMAQRQRDALARRKALLQAREMRKSEPKYFEPPEQSGDAEADSAADLNALQSGFRARAGDDQARKRIATDSEFWACICFNSRAQKEAFIAALGLTSLGDKYIDGLKAASLLGIGLPASDIVVNGSPRVDPTWASMSN